MADHFISAIEERWELDPNQTFNKVLFSVFDTFSENKNETYPVSNFFVMVKSKTKTLESYWSKNLFVYLKGFFSWPKIVLTFFISYLFYLSIQWGGVLLFRMNLIFIFFFSLIAVGVYFYKNKEDQSKFIFLKSYTRFFFLYLVFIPYSFIGLFINHMPDSINSIPFVLKFGAAFLLSLWVISIYACMVVFPAKVKKELAPYKFA